MELVKTDTLITWEDILPEDAPRIYINNQWISYEQWEKEENRRFTSPPRKVLHMLFTSQYLNITTKEKYDLFSIKVLVFDNMVVLNDMHLLKLNVGQTFGVVEAAKYALKNPYLKSKDKKSIYYLGAVNSYKHLTQNILQIARGHSALFTLGEDWLVKGPTKSVSSSNKYKGWPQR